MGADFSGVKVYTDAQADQLSRSIQAKAFTTGQDVFFRQGAYEPRSRGGQELIAHELTHVVQQNSEKAKTRTKEVTSQQQIQDVLALKSQNSAIAIMNTDIIAKQTIQRRAIWDEKEERLIKKGREGFGRDLTKAMKVSRSEHRCHVVPYEETTESIIDPINAHLSGKQKYNIKFVHLKLLGIIHTVFLGKTRSRRHQQSDLNNLASKYYTKAINEAKIIEGILETGYRKEELVAHVNLLIKACNNSVDNLRSGDATTNTSIQAGIDPLESKQTVLKAGTIITDDIDSIGYSLKKQKKVITFDDNTNEQVLNLLTTTHSKTNTIYGFSTGTEAQRSNAGIRMTDISMTDKSLTNFAIRMHNGNYFIL